MSKVYSGSINDEDRSEAIAFGTRPQYSVKMGHLFRSEQMALVELFIQSEAAHATVLELGEVMKEERLVLVGPFPLCKKKKNL